MKNELTFEEAISKLEDIVESLESGNLGLDQSIKMFQEGMELSGFCSKKLDDAEKKISMLIQTEDGDYKEVPFEVEGE